MCNCYHYDRAVHISVAVDMRTFLDRNNFSSSSNGQVAAHSFAMIKACVANRGVSNGHAWGDSRPTAGLNFHEAQELMNDLCSN